MVDVKSKRCIQIGCQKQPAFNLEGQTRVLYCSEHKLDNMVDVKSKRCIQIGCQKHPVYNLEGQTRALYCASHKLDNMVDVKSKRCIQIGCQKHPVYNLEGQTRALYCASHKLDNMVDVKSKRCIQIGCQKQPVYNLEGQRQALYCVAHKLDNMVDIKHKRCKSDWCSTRPHEKYDGYCLFCYMNLFPDKPVSRNYKTKERSVVEYITAKFATQEWKLDQRIAGGCSRRRPDLLLDLGYQIMIVEIDENQHTDYDCSCENKRIMELSQDLGHRPIIFIRFNPDDYLNQTRKIKSCWGINGNGICVVRKTKMGEWNQRLQSLEQQINYWIDPANRTNKTVEIIQLFYDR